MDVQHIDMTITQEDDWFTAGAVVNGHPVTACARDRNDAILELRNVVDAALGPDACLGDRVMRCRFAE